MKKISLLLMISASSLFLTGCWKRKKKDAQSKTSGLVLTENEVKHERPDVEAIEYVDNSQEYKVAEVKTIFADDDVVLDETVVITNNEQPEQSFLDQLHMKTEAIAETTSNILAENKQKESVGIVYFDFDASEDVKKQSNDTLKLIINKLNELAATYPNLEINIEGHACNSCGSERYNLVLSDDRAKTVKKKIVESTVIPAEKIFETGYGTSHMIVSGNRTEQAPNRRAEVFVVLNK